MLPVSAVVYVEGLEHSTRARWVRAARERTVRLPHWTAFVSQQSRQRAVDAGPLRAIADRCCVVPRGIDLSPYAEPADTTCRAQTRRELGLPADAVAVACVGLLWHAEGQEYVIGVLNSPERKSGPVILLLVGCGSDGEGFRASAEQMGVADHVRFLGWRSDVPRVLQALDILGQPSLTKGLPLAVVEAAVAGLPIAASPAGGIPEIITHGHDGLLVAPGDPEALATAILGLLDDRERAWWPGDNAWRTAFERSSAEAMAQAYMAL